MNLTPADLAVYLRESVKDKSYRETPLGTLVGRYVRWFRNEWGATPDTIRDYEAVLARMSLTLADKEPEEVTIEDLRLVVDLWAERAAKTRQKVTSVIRAFWTWAEDNGHVEHSPAAKLRRPRAPRKIAPLMPLDSDKTLLSLELTPRDRVGLCLLLWCGVRRGELRRVQVRNFDLGRSTLTIYGKGQKERVLPLRGAILNEIKFWLQADLPYVGRPLQPDDFLLYPVDKNFGEKGPEGEQPLTFKGRPKDEPSPQYIHRWWYRMLEMGGLVAPGVRRGLNMHRARHTFAQEMRRTAGVEAASQALGHSHLSTTLDIYGHQDASDLERAMEAFAERKAEQ